MAGKNLSFGNGNRHDAHRAGGGRFGMGKRHDSRKEGNGAWAAVYRTEFTMPFKWIDREIFARLDAVSRAYYVYANGHLAGYHADSKTPAYFDITPYVADGKNTLAVIAYAHPVSTTLENQIKTPGTCIEGDVSVIAQPKVRIRDFVADTRFATDGNGLFSFGAIVKSHLLNPKEVIVYYELIAPDDSTVIAHGKRDARFHLRAEDTVRFSPTYRTSSRGATKVRSSIPSH